MRIIKKALSLIMATCCLFSTIACKNEGEDTSVNRFSESITCSHSYSNIITKAATCKEKGVRTYTCEHCGDSYDEDIQKTDVHSYTSKITKKRTCKEKGVTTYTCEICGAFYTEEIMKSNIHSYIGKVTKNPTCKEDGEKTYTCEVCGIFYVEPINKTSNHIWQAATCTQAMTCIRCATNSGNVNVFAHTGIGECSDCGINYYNALKDYVYLYGIQGTSNSGQYWCIEDYLYISGKLYELTLEYHHLSHILCSISIDDYENGFLTFNLLIEDSAGVYDYFYMDTLGTTADTLGGSLIAKNITKNITELPYEDINCLDGYHTDDYIQLKSCEYLKLLLTALNEFMNYEGLGIGTKHFGFTNYPSNGD